MSYAYTPHDSYLGQLSGCLEALHAGTTTVLDHAHIAYTPEHGWWFLVSKLLSKVADSGRLQ